MALNINNICNTKSINQIQMSHLQNNGTDTHLKGTKQNLNNEYEHNINAGGEFDACFYDMDFISVETKKPHFLDYDAIPPPECVNRFNNGKIDATLTDKGYTKKELTEDDKLRYTSLSLSSGVNTEYNKEFQENISKRKHFLDENPIPPDYLTKNEIRDHGLDYIFDRRNESLEINKSLSSSLNDCEYLLDSECGNDAEPSVKEENFIDKHLGSFLLNKVPKGRSWSERFNGTQYNSYMSQVSCSGNTTFGSKVECVYSLLSLLGSKNPLEISRKLVELSENSETCSTLRRSGCIPLLVQIMHSTENDDKVRKLANTALQNVVHCNPEEKIRRRESKVLRLLEQVMNYCNFLRSLLQSGGEAIADDSDRHPLAAISSLMKISFDEEHRYSMCQLGALHAIPNLVHLDHAVHGPKPENQCCISLRRYALMALTNLTFGDENNKALLCSQKLFMEALVGQLDSAPDDLLQVTASVLRNLSWRADNNMKAVLNEIGTVTALAHAAMKNKNENTLKAILSALWNLSAHCSTNKAEFCAVNGALAFLVSMLTYEGPSKTLKIIENAGGILRNVSSHIAVCESYRYVLREHNCLSILLQQLKSESLTVVSNSCGTLWNLSARCPEDQKFLWDNGAVPMLRSLIHSKHVMISEGSSSALKNLLSFRPAAQNSNRLDPITRSLGLKKLPTLQVRKQKAFQQELCENKHAETSDILDVVPTPGTTVSSRLLSAEMRLISFPKNNIDDTNELKSRLSRSATLRRSESKDSINSSKSDSVYELVKRSRSASAAKCDMLTFTKPCASRVSNTFVIENDTEVIEEKPIDYSMKYNENLTLSENMTQNIVKETNSTTKSKFQTYQETDIDQPTDFSLRYAENQIDVEASTTEIPNQVISEQVSNVAKPKLKDEDGNEILLILEDSVKCYQTEDTPYIISNAASITDLRHDIAQPQEIKNTEIESKVPKKHDKHSQYGSFTPERPINYCEEGTPEYFSRHGSLSSLDEAKPLEITKNDTIKADGIIKPNDTKTNPNSALETPLMFSRRSSIDSLVNEDVGPNDDKSSIVSEFSRLASGVVSPSELPDSPTQSMPQSPHNNRIITAVQHTKGNTNIENLSENKPRVGCVFEDDLNTFNIENTPAQFSCVTSLSNLSIHDFDNERNRADSKAIAAENSILHNQISKGEPICFNDDYLLASCISIGMNRNTENSKSKNTHNFPNKTHTLTNNLGTIGDVPKQYCTEDTPALLSKVGSNSNLSVISTESIQNMQIGGPSIAPKKCLNKYNSQHTQSLSENASSNTSECGPMGASSEILHQCILDGMKKQSNTTKFTQMDPIGMMRRGGDSLPTYLHITDEMNKYNVEDSPCNFSIVSGLSNLTIGSSVHKVNVIANIDQVNELPDKEKVQPKEIVIAEQQYNDDSLSSLSIDSEDDTNLLSQAIAAGCNRPKSNLGFNTKISPIKKSSSASSSQLTAASTSSLNSKINELQTKDRIESRMFSAVDDSNSSVDSSDSNDNHSKSLFELCILTGMYKKRNCTKNKHRRFEISTRTALSNSNLKKFDSLPTDLTDHKTSTFHQNRHHQYHRKQDLKDEKLLLECINTGISKKIECSTGSSNVNQVNRDSVTEPKNGQTTSAAALEQYHKMEHITSTSVDSIAAPDVEKNELIKITPQNSFSNNSIIASESITNAIENHLPTIAKNVLSVDQPTEGFIKYMNNSKTNAITTGYKFENKINTTNGNENSKVVERSILPTRHRDPDLMLRSVERLTSEFVTSAGQLTTQFTKFEVEKKEQNCLNNHIFSTITINPLSLKKETNMVNITTDDAHIKKDLIANITDGSEIDLKENISYEKQLRNIDNITEQKVCTTLGINFQVGGQVQSAAKQFNDVCASGMTHSTMIAFEARTVSENLMQLTTDNDNADVTFSINSLDLDNVHPPSGMDSLNTLDCYCEHFPTQAQQVSSKAITQTLTDSPNLVRKLLPTGLVARRALGQLAGSVESVNSSYNFLDNVKPPSLMDELLDSMVSVASIQSEIAECENNKSSLSNYETAASISHSNENSIVTQSLCESSSTSTYDGNHNEKTDKYLESVHKDTLDPTNHPNVDTKRSLTAKRKRMLDKDRYKTYTISTDIISQISIKSEESNANEYQELLKTNNEVYVECFKSERRIAADTQIMVSPANCENAALQSSTTINNLKDMPKIAINPMQEKPQATASNSYESKKELKVVKAIRGQNKSSYISPYSLKYNSNNSRNPSTSLAAVKSSKSVTNKTSMPNVKTTKNSKALETNINIKTFPPPMRQSTFIKDEPTNAELKVPVVTTMVNLNQRASKLPKKQIKNTLKSNLTVKQCSIIPKKDVQRNSTLRTGITMPQRSNTHIRLSSSNTSVKTANHTKLSSASTPPTRSNSNLGATNNNVVQNTGAAGSNLRVHQAHNRLNANIRKPVGEFKSRNVHLNSNASKCKTQTKSAEALNGVQKLIGSLTFDSTVKSKIQRTRKTNLNI